MPAAPLYGFVLDCSITMSWCFEDESTKEADEILNRLAHSKAIVPTIWPLEVANVLLLAKKKGRISNLQSVNFIDALSALPIIVDSNTTARAWHSIYVLAEQTELTIYDAAYLELALREKLPLFTLDKSLLKAAKIMGISSC